MTGCARRVNNGSALILRSHAQHGVSKDGNRPLAAIIRDAASRLLRMREVCDAPAYARQFRLVGRNSEAYSAVFRFGGLWLRLTTLRFNARYAPAIPARTLLSGPSPAPATGNAGSARGAADTALRFLPVPRSRTRRLPDCR